MDISKIYSQKIVTFFQTCIFQIFFDKFGEMLTDIFFTFFVQSANISMFQNLPFLYKVVISACFRISNFKKKLASKKTNYIHAFFISSAKLKLAKMKQTLINKLGLNFNYWNLFTFFFKGDILKYKQNNIYIYIHLIIRLIIIEMKMETKNRSQKNDTNSSRSIQWYKYRNYKKCLSMMISSIHEKVKQHCGWI